MAIAPDALQQWIVITLLLPRCNDTDEGGLARRRAVMQSIQDWMQAHHHVVRMPAVEHSLSGDCIAVSFRSEQADQALDLRILAGQLDLISEMKQFRVTETYTDRTTHPKDRPLPPV